MATILSLAEGTVASSGRTVRVQTPTTAFSHTGDHPPALAEHSVSPARRRLNSEHSDVFRRTAFGRLPGIQAGTVRGSGGHEGGQGAGERTVQRVVGVVHSA
jgi:hypothetical protein